jgi:outer membrane protein assembly factor BamB
MSDVRDALSRATRSEDGSGMTIEDIYARTHRRRVRERAIAGIVAGVVALGGFGVTLQLIARSDVDVATPSSSRVDPRTLRLAWTAKVDSPGSTIDVLTDADRVYVAAPAKLVAFPQSCQASCDPEWQMDLSGGGPAAGAAPEMASDGSVLVVAVDDTITAISQDDCRQACRPLWSVATRGIVSSPVAVDGRVIATVTRGEAGQQRASVVAFDAECRTDGGVCKPLWVAPAGTGPAFGPGTVVDGVFYRQIGDTLFGFAPGCDDDGRVCRPDFAVRSTGAPGSESVGLYGPIQVGNLLVVSSGTGHVSAFRPHCGDSCAAVWTAMVSSHGLSGAPFASGDGVVVVGTPDGRIVALDGDCPDPCRPLWTAEFGPGTTVQYVNEDLVVVTRAFGPSPSVLALRSRPLARERLAWSSNLAGEPLDVEGDGIHLFVSSSNAVEAFALDCAGECPPVWQTPVASVARSLTLAGDRLIVLSESEQSDARTPPVLQMFAGESG